MLIGFPLEKTEAISSKLLEIPFYLHRDFSFGIYRFWNTSYPSLNDNYVVSNSYTVGSYILPLQWITKPFPYDKTLDLNYCFKFAIYSNCSGNGVFRVLFYRFRNGSETQIYTSPYSSMIAQYSSPVLNVFFDWIKSSLTIKENDRLILRLELRVLQTGKFSLGYDCLAYPSHVLDPSTESLFPTGSGARTELTSSSGNNWDCVNEVPVNDGDYVYSTSTTTLIDLYAITSTAIPLDSIVNSVTVYWRAKKLVYPTSRIANGHAKIRTNGTEYGGTSQALTNSWANYSYTWNTNPFSSSAWTIYDIIALQIGVALKITTADSGQSMSSQVYAIVSYTLPTITQKLYHSLNIDIGISQFLKTIYKEYSDLTISIGLSQYLKTVFSMFSSLNIDVGLTQTVNSILGIVTIILYHSLNIIVSLSQYLLSPVLPYLIPFWIGFLLLCAIVLGLLLYSER